MWLYKNKSKGGNSKKLQYTQPTCTSYKSLNYLNKQVTSFVITKQENQSTDYRFFFFSNGEITPVNVYPCSKALVDLFSFPT